MRKKIVAFAVIVVAVIGAVGEGYFVSGDDLAPPDEVSTKEVVAEQFSWGEFLPEEQVSTTNWRAVTQSGPLKTYQALRESIVDNSITPDAIEAIEYIFDDATSEQMGILLSELENGDRSKVIPLLYEAMMRAPSSKEVFFDHLSSRLQRVYRLVDENFEDNGRHFGWALTIKTYAALTTYQYTRDRRFLDLAAEALSLSLPYRDSEIGRVDEFRHRAMKSWGGNRYVEDGRHSTNVTLGGRMAFVLALFAETVRKDPSLAGEYGDLADEFLQAARDAIDEYTPEFEVTPDARMGFWVRPTHGNDIEPLNHMAWGGSALILLHELTGEDQYGRMAEQLARFFRHCMRMEEDGVLWWRYQPLHDDFFGRGTEWVWKARTTAQFIYFGYEHGVVFTEEDMQGVGKMLLSHVYRPDGTVSARIDPKYRAMEDYQGFRGNYLAITPFLPFSIVNPDVGERIIDMVATRPDIGGWMNGRHGVDGYAYRFIEQIAP